MTYRTPIAAVGPLILALAGIAASLSPAMARDGTEAISACRALQRDAERLACYDREVGKLVPPTYQGRLNLITEPFAIMEPTRVRFQSDGAIFVLYVKSSDEKVVQNLHIGGGGEDSYLIETPGTYFLQINGSESWRIWLEPRPVSRDTVNPG